MKHAPTREDFREHVNIDTSVLPKGTRLLLGYSRRSKGEMDADFVERNERLMIRNASKANAVIVAWYRETVSGYNAKAIRHAFRALLEDVEHCDGLAIPYPDRIARNDYDIGCLIRMYELNPLKILVIGDPDDEDGDNPCPYDMATTSGRDRLVEACRGAKRESRQAARRQRDKHDQRRRKGNVHSVMRPFGLNDDKATLRESECKHIRNAAVDLLDGKSMSTIVREWQALGLKTSTGTEWTVRRLRELLVCPRMAGFRVKMIVPKDKTRAEQSVMIGDDKLAVYAHESIIDLQTWCDVCAFLFGRTKVAQSPKAKFELTGLLRCELCLAVLAGNVRPPAPNGDPRWIFSCPAPTNGGCGKTSISGHVLTPLIIDMAKARLASLPTVSHDPGPFDDDGRAEQITSSRQSVVARNLAGTISDDTANAFFAQLDAQAAQLRRERDAWTRARTKSIKAAPESWLTRYERADTDQKRALLADMIDYVTIPSSNGPKGPRYNLNRVRPEHVHWNR